MPRDPLKMPLPALIAYTESILPPMRKLYLQEMESRHPGPGGTSKRSRAATPLRDALRAAEGLRRAVARLVRKGLAGRGCVVLAEACAEKIQNDGWPQLGKFPSPGRRGRKDDPCQLRLWDAAG